MDIRRKIQTLLADPQYHPLRRAELAAKLRLTTAERRDFRRTLDDMLRAGEIVRVRQDRFVLPQEADLVIGQVQFNEKGFAFLIPETPGLPDIYIAEEDTWVAMHGDKVVVRLYRERRRGTDKTAGRVIRILERAHTTLVGTLQKTKTFHYVVPDDPRLIRNIYVPPHPHAHVGHKVVVALAEWKNRHVNPEGTITEVLGKADAPGVDIISIIRKYHLPLEFSPQTLAEVDRIPDTIPTAGRLDLRDKFIITIDPDDAKDFDDAVHVDELPDGGWRLGVHIADVSHYVTPGSALDREASARGNSVYLVDRVIPMLPEKLSNNLCSLRPREDRLTQTVLIEFDKHLRHRKTDFALSVIHSRHRLTYREAYALLSNESPADAVAALAKRGHNAPATLRAELHKMWRLAKQLRAQRFAHGSLALEFPEVKVRLDKHGKPTHIEKIEYDISHQLIEEFMLAANEAVARRICQLQIPCLYRIHEDPSLEKLRDFRAYAQSFGFKVGDVAHRHELQKLLDHVAGKPEQYAINLALLRSLKRAVYSTTCAGHYGLAKKYYTHFTSPIRRYADLVVHRTLRAIVTGTSAAASAAALAKRGRTTAAGTLAPSLQSLAKIAAHISQTERTAAEAEQESVELKKIEYFQQQLDTGKLTAMEAVVCTVRNFGIFVELPDSLVQGLVHISTLEDDFYHYDEQREQLVGKRTRRTIKIGDKLRVRVAKVDVFKRQIDFRVVP